MQIMLRRQSRTPVLLVSPETGQLPANMGLLAPYISGKSGGLGEVIAALCEGLTSRGIVCHLATMNLEERFKKENCLQDKEWGRIFHCIDPDRIHLVNSSLFSELPSAYAGNPLLNAAEFQKALVNQVIVRIRAQNGGRLIIHSHDWMAGGAVAAYAKAQGCPVLHTLHNVHTGHIPLDWLFGIDTRRLSSSFYLSQNEGKACMDSQATAVKNADAISFVGRRFLQEMIENQFADSSIIPSSIRHEVRVKYDHGAAMSILNAPSPGMYPERCCHLVRPYGPDDDVMAAKRENLIEFQKRTGLEVNGKAILLYWPSRLDPSQKGIELLEDIAHRFVIAHGDTQIAIIGDGVGDDRTHEEICGRIAWSSGGKIIYQKFSEPLSMLGFAAASDVFGASLYEPCGQIDQLGNLFGATATNRDTGGYHDKIRELTLVIDGATEDTGNGFLFRDYDTGGLWYGLEKSVRFHRLPHHIREEQIIRIMRETRLLHNVDRMIEDYITAYGRINGGIPLA